MIDADKAHKLAEHKAELSMMLAEKALQIRRLIEDNKNLSTRLSQLKLYGSM